jgi:hypothetical protein
MWTLQGRLVKGAGRIRLRQWHSGVLEDRFPIEDIE